MSLEGVLLEIRAERARQDAQWGPGRHLTDTTWMTILTEEVGEAAEAVLARALGSPSVDADLARELIQVAAVAVCWMEAIHERNAR